MGGRQLTYMLESCKTYFPFKVSLFQINAHSYVIGLKLYLGKIMFRIIIDSINQYEESCVVLKNIEMEFELKKLKTHSHLLHTL